MVCRQKSSWPLSVLNPLRTSDGNFGVVDALSTLAFDYPPRAKFFRGQLTQHFLLSREEGKDPLSMKGSYAGAMLRTIYSIKLSELRC